MDDDKRQSLLDDLCSQEDMSTFLTQINDKVFYMGAVDLSDKPNKETLDKQVKRVLSDREKLLEFLFECTEVVNVKDLDYVKQSKIDYLEKVKNLTLAFKRADEKLKEELFKEATAFIKENKHIEHVLTIEEMIEITDFIKIMKSKNETISRE